MNPADPKTDHQLTQLSGGGWDPLDWSPDDKTILLMEEISINETYLWLVNAATGEKTELTPRRTDEQVSYQTAHTSARTEKVFMSRPTKVRNSNRLAYIDLATKKMTIGSPQSFLGRGRVPAVLEWQMDRVPQQ
jgi:hypothetical protein